MTTQFKVLGCGGSESQSLDTCSFLLGDSVLFDVGSAASLLSLEEQQAIQTIFLTHAHLDHVKDLAFLGENVFAEDLKTIEIYGHQDVLDAVHKHLLNEVLWPDFTRLPSKQKSVFAFKNMPCEKVHTLSGLGGIKIEAIEVNHPGPTLGYVITAKKQALVYAGDTGPTERIWEVINQRPEISDVLIETSFPNRLSELANEAHHLTPQMLATELKKIERPDIKLHVYHIKAPYMEEVTRELEALGDERLSVLQPGTTFSID